MVEEEEDARSATTTTRGRDDGDGDDDDDDDAMDVATDDDEAMKMPFNAPTLTLRRTRVGSRTTRRGEPGGWRIETNARRQTRGRDETRARRGVQRASDGNLTTEIDRDDDRNDAASTERGVRARSSRRRDADEDSDDDDDKNIRDAVSRRAIRAFVPLVADCAPPGPRSGLRAFSSSSRRHRETTTRARRPRIRAQTRLRAVPRSVRRTSTSSRRSRRRRRRCDHRRCFRR